MVKFSLNKNLVYLFGFSPWQGIQLQNLVEIISFQNNKNANINIVLIHDGVIGISKKATLPSALKELLKLQLKIYAMIPDLKARGILLKDVRDEIKCIEYSDLVDILIENSNIISWM